MLEKTTFAAVRSAVFAVTVLIGAAPPAPGGEGPPLKGAFAVNFTLLDPPVPAPLGTFEDLSNRPVRLGDFKGRVVLVNFWATWCPPCIREMPSLDRLQAGLKDRGLTVLAVSLDRDGRDAVVPFIERLGLEHMGIYLDPEAALARAFGVSGLPTTFLIDASNRVVGGMAGPAEWQSPEALALIRHYLRDLPKGPGTAIQTGG